MKAHIVMRVAVAFGVSTLFWSVASFAQVDTNPPAPNVLLLIDNSGSMERMIDGTIPESNPANACNCIDNGPNHAPTCTFPDVSNAAASSPNPNRWNTLQQVMTGSLAAQAGANAGFNCVAMPRAANSTFSQEYQIAGNPPYDLNYYLNYHRMVAEDTTAGTGAAGVACVVGPGPLPGATSPNGVVPAGATLSAGGSATDYSTSSLIDTQYGILTSPRSAACNFTQLPNGIISNTTAFMRYGLMMFDSDPDPHTGITPGPPLVVGPSPFTGMWSYFPGWNTGASCNFAPWGAFAPNCQGDPVGCSTPQWMAVGARNPAAPPWEGRMVAFPTSSGPTQAQINTEIGQVILGSRPYGGTPLAGMFTAAQYFFQGDPAGPQSDPFVQSSGTPCRKEFIILVTDGAPNLDLRPSCNSPSEGGASGSCPFNIPQAIAANLFNNGMPNGTQQFITTYVIGFATSSFANDGGNPIDCRSLVTSGTLASVCNNSTGILGGPPPDPTYAPCCTLEQIAVAGSQGGHAFFAQSALDLQSALQTILGQINTGQTTRTTPAFSPVLSATGNAQEYSASFQPNVGGPWTGDIIRTTYACPTMPNSGPPTPTAPNPLNGDDFSTNINLTPALRNFVTIQPMNALNTVHDGTQSIRPHAPATPSDGLTTFETATVSGLVNASTATTNLSFDALGIPPGVPVGNSYPYTPINGTGTATAYLNQTQTRSMALSFIFGQAEPSLPSNFPWVSRCPSCGPGNTGVGAFSAFGDIYHAEPVVVGAPEALLDDASYSGFRTFVTSTAGGGDGGTGSPRSPVVYAATNDGLLHAFYANEGEVNNEAWAMLMPLGLPELVKSYPATDELLLDGSPVVQDVVWNRTTINSTECGSGTTVTSAPTGTGTGTCPWHTMLVAGYGSAQQGYYAVDVTSPVAPSFQWQLTTMPPGPPANYQIFGKYSATPAIATVNLNGAEVGVAVLPGGSNGSPTSTTASCERIHHHTGTGTDSEPYNTSAPFYQERAYVRCWGPTATYTDPVPGRSLSIVRLDTGEIVRVFARASGESSGHGDFNATDTLVTYGGGVVTDTQLDSPMTGTPVVYPNDVGSVATRIFVGDADGTVWRFDVSNPNPALWFGDAFLDLYSADADSSATSWNDGQPFAVPMVASLDNTGSVVLNIASGTTQTFDTTGIEFLYSVSEKVGGQGTASNPTKLRASVNWFWSPVLPPPAIPPTNTTTTSPSPLLPGERVSGPMTVFAGTLYFTTYYAGNPTLSCTPGRAKLWGFDFIKPEAGAIGLGGNRLLTCSASQDWLDPGFSCAIPGTQPDVVPGVAILATPACSTQATGAVAGGVTHTALSNVSASSFALQFNVPQPNGTPQTESQTLTNPVGPTVIDSWASVVE
jgi:type IV pilus assembly protein PilY1